MTDDTRKDPPALAATVADRGGPVPTDDIPRGALFGRYVILERLGAGGMGVVYRAYDPDLDRRVALKVVRVDSASVDPAEVTEGRARLLLEAQAMARLSHPNVISVFDVGIVDDDVFVAMELIDGPNLRDWLKDAPRATTEIVATFAQAGRGLAAAHEAGLVHRDFKPDNVLVGADGRVRVLDFGLARALAREPVEGEVPARDPLEIAVTPRHDSNARLTQTGSLLGTPAYMAPEQHLGLTTTASSDQFAFCVALYEALDEELPFAGATYREYAANVVAGRLKEPRAPRWLKRVLTRGLAVKWEDRYPSMNALLDELARDPRRVQRRALAAVGVLAACGVLTYAALAPRSADNPCRGADGKLAGVWDATRAAAVKAAFLATGKAGADADFTSVAAALDGYTSAWTADRTNACEATYLRGEQSGALLDQRMLCLDERLQVTKVFVTLLAAADAPLVERAPIAVRGLPDFRECDDARGLMGAVKPPAGMAMRAQVSDVRDRLAEVKALMLAGHFKDARDAATTAAIWASAIDYRPIQAQAIYNLADMQSRAGDAATAEATMRVAARLAQAARDGRLLALIDIELTALAGNELKHAAAGLAYAKDAEAALEAIGNDDALAGKLAGYEGQLSLAQDHFPEALERFQRSCALLEKAFGPDDLELASALNDLGGAYRELHRFPEAQAALGRALAIREKLLGPDHPFVASTVFNLGNLLLAQGHYEEARVQHQRSLEIRERALGPDHPRVAESLASLANDLGSLGRVDEAFVDLRRAIAIQEKALGPDAAQLAITYGVLGNLLRGAERYDEALAALQHALAIREKALGADHPDLAIPVFAIGDVYRATHKYDLALAAYQRALAIDLKANGPDNPDLAYDYTGLGEVQLALKKPADAQKMLERALALRTKTPGDPADLAETQFNLACALWDGHGDHARAIQLATAARGLYANAGPGAKKEVQRLDDWLAGHH